MSDRRALEAGSQPPLLYPPYLSTAKRAPAQPLIIVPERFSSLAAPVYGYLPMADTDNDLTRQHAGEPGLQQWRRLLQPGSTRRPDVLHRQWPDGRYRCG